MWHEAGQTLDSITAYLSNVPNNAPAGIVLPGKKGPREAGMVADNINAVVEMVKPNSPIMPSDLAMRLDGFARRNKLFTDADTVFYGASTYMLALSDIVWRYFTLFNGVKYLTADEIATAYEKAQSTELGRAGKLMATVVDVILQINALPVPDTTGWTTYAANISTPEEMQAVWMCQPDFQQRVLEYLSPKYQNGGSGPEWAFVTRRNFELENGTIDFMQ